MNLKQKHMQRLGIVALICFVVLFSSSIYAQHSIDHPTQHAIGSYSSPNEGSYLFADLGEEPKQPSAALRRSLLLPGWGEYYANPNSWTRGQWHMAADISMILSYLGISYRSIQLEDELITFARSKAGIDLSGRDREWYLAVSNHNTLDLYNDYLLRTRNWNQLIEDNSINQWSWSETSDRSEFNRMREQIDKSKNQLPALLTLMVLNRVVSGIHAFGLVRDSNKLMDSSNATLYTRLDILQPEWSNQGYVGLELRLSF
jgi:hypothetical protein